MGRPHRRRLAPPLHEPLLSRAERRARGVYYTPPEIVRQLVRLTLDGILTRRVSEAKLTRRASEGPRRPLRILDPACGAGAMLAEVRAQLSSMTSIEVFGVDLDPAAVTACRTQLLSRDQTWSRSGSAGASPSRPPPAQKFAIDVWHGDALFDDRLDSLGPFDVIVGNPPFVNIRQLAQCQPAAYIDQLRQRFRTVRGNFDLYVPFVERAWELLAPGGRCGLIVPNKWATLDYARPLRELLLAETTIEHVVDLSAIRVFAEASVYPHLLGLHETAAGQFARRAISSWAAQHGVAAAAALVRGHQLRRCAGRRVTSRDQAARRIGNHLVRHARLFGPASGCGADRSGAGFQPAKIVPEG